MLSHVAVNHEIVFSPSFVCFEEGSRLGYKMLGKTNWNLAWGTAHVIASAWEPSSNQQSLPNLLFGFDSLQY